MNDKWNGEARGCSDVMFTRIQILMRKHKIKGRYSNLHDSVMSLVTYCEEQDKRLTDVLEDVYIELKGDIDDNEK